MIITKNLFMKVKFIGMYPNVVDSTNRFIYSVRYYRPVYVFRIKLGAPTRELYIDDRWYECYFGGMPITVDLGGKKVSVKLEGPPPLVKIGTVKRTDLVVAKINLIINARNMVPVFLDAKPQMLVVFILLQTLD